MENSNSRFLKTHVYTLRMDFILSERLKKISEVKHMKPSRFIREAIKKAIDIEMPSPEKKSVGRPKKNRAPTTKEIKTEKQMNELITMFKMFKAREEKAVGSYVMKLYADDKLDAKFKQEIQKVLDDC